MLSKSSAATPLTPAPGMRYCLIASVAMALCVAWPLSSAHAQTATAAQAAGAQEVAKLRGDGRHADAAALGLKELLGQPWNHQLRLLVADSLQRTGRASEAAAQLEALEGTPVAAEAAQRLSGLRVPQQSFIPATVLAPAPALASPGGRPMGVAGPTSEDATLSPFRYVPADQGAPGNNEIKRPPVQEALFKLSLDGNYQKLGTDGLTAMKTEKLDDELRLRVANSLAWTGRLREAEQTYRGLLTTPYAADARLGQANIQRWLGQHQAAVPIYKEVLTARPGSLEAATGLRVSQRELRPVTRLTLGGSTDSDNVERRYLGVSHQWREDGGKRIWEVEASGVRDTSTTHYFNHPEAVVRYTALDWRFQPSFEVSADGRSLYASATGAFTDLPVWVTAGRVNWGRMSNNPRALYDELSAYTLGARASFDGSLGNLSVRGNHYSVSDGNSVQTGAIRYVPSWRPLGPSLRLLVGAEMRTAKFNTSAYWSPDQGYGVGYVGLLGDWGTEDFSVFGSIERGWRLFGDAGKAASAAGGFKYWISDDWALGLNLWAMNSMRATVPYKARSGYLSLEHRWQ